MNEEYEILKDKKIGYALTGSFCTLAESMRILRQFKENCAEVLPIVSYNVNVLDTKFGAASYWRDEIISITGKEPIDTIPKAEPIGPKALLDAIVVLPCSGNTLGKLAGGITDTPVCMAVKAHLRNNRPVIIGVSSNDGLGVSAANIGRLMNNKNIYLIPFGQDSPDKKQNSLVCDFNAALKTVAYALDGKQLQPVLREFK